MVVMVIIYSMEGQGAMFAAADEFSHLLDDDMTSSSSPADAIGSSAVCRHDNAGTLIPLYAAVAIVPSFVCL